MKVGTYFNIFKIAKFEFGDQVVTQFILFECKYLFSIIFFYFHKCEEGTQDRFHTHAFKAISIRIFGDYLEDFLVNDQGEFKSKPRSRHRFLYIPRNCFHRIGRSKGCLTMLLSGPWKKEWKEFITETKEYKTYRWGRNNGEIEVNGN